MIKEVLDELVKDAKQRVRKTKEIFDDEIRDLLLACEQDLLKANAAQNTQMNVNNVEEFDPLLKRAFMTYVKAYFGENENAKHYIADYELQKARLQKTSGYTRWRSKEDG